MACHYALYPPGKVSSLEYDIGPVSIETNGNTTEEEFSIACVRFKFIRKSKYHLANTFFQTLLLICIGHLSLLFNEKNFADKLMVTLTTMLVIVTLMSSIQAVPFVNFGVYFVLNCFFSFQGLPKTSYYKFIDYWLLFCVVSLALTMVVHIMVARILDPGFGMRKKNKIL